MHVLVRFLTCPFLRVVRELPAGGSLLDIGAGHGLFARLAQDRGLGPIVTVEPDVRKVRKLAGIEAVIGYDDCLRGAFDAISIIDVLYKVPVQHWDSLLTRVLERLRPGGLFLLKEQDPTARIKNSWNRLQERAASSLGITIGESFSYEAPAAMTARLERIGFKDVQWKRIDRFYPHPHVLYLARR